MKRLIIISVSLLCGCPSGPQLAPEAAVLAQSVKHVHQGQAAGFDEADSADAYNVNARFNPARCDCPDFEFEIYGRWVRAYPAGSANVMATLQRFSERVASEDEVSDIVVTGRTTGSTKPSKRNIEYPVFEIESLPTP